MKDGAPNSVKPLVTSLALILGTVVAAGRAVIHIAGMVSFQNTESARPPGTPADFHLVYAIDGTLLVGTQNLAELWIVIGGTVGQVNGSLIPVPRSISSFKPATTSLPGTWSGKTVALPDGYGGVDVFSDGSGEAGTDAGGFPGADGTGHYPLTLRVRFWDSTTGDSYDSASVHNQNLNFTYVQRATGAVSDLQMINQPGLVPEPTAIALTLLGAAGLLVFQRRDRSAI